MTDRTTLSPRRTRVTIRDVAARADVSVTTVSHVLNRVAGTRIADETRDRIEAAAADLGYRPNRLARSLRQQTSKTIGFVSDSIATTPFAGQIILGAQDAAAEAGYVLLLVTSNGDPRLEAQEVRALLDRQVDGILYASMFHRVIDVPPLLTETRAVLLDASASDLTFSSVVPDEVGGARAAVEELLRQGHRRIGFLNHNEPIPAATGRLLGYRQAIEGHGLTFDSDLVVHADTATGGFDAALGLLSRSDRPTALFCFADRMAMGAYQAAQELGLRIPDDVSVVGFDDQQIISAGLRPGLTTMALPHYEMGHWATSTLLDLIKDPGRPRHQVLLPCPLVRRDSVAPPPHR